MKKILLIEDERDFMEGIATILNYEGFSPIMAFNGEKGITMARKELPDIILCDIVMPGVDGFEVLSQLKSDVSTSLIPFIFITALDQRDKRRHGMEMGADDFLIKPFTRQELMKTLKARLSKKDAIEKNLLAMRKNIIYSLPHELKSPLNVIIGFSQIIKEKAETLPLDEISQMGKYIYESGYLLNEIFQKYLTFIDVELNNTKEFHTEPLIISNIRKIIEPIAQSYNRSDDYNLDIADYKIKIIKEWFFIALKELIDNAFKFSEKGQVVSIKTRLSNSYIELLIHDEGRGFSHANVNDINAFVQFDRKVFQQRGIGMGLHLAKRIIEIHQGTLNIVSLPGKGTNICIQLPYVE